MNGSPCIRVGVPVQPGGPVEAGRPQLHPLEVGVVHQVGPGDLLVVEADPGDHAVDEPDVVRDGCRACRPRPRCSRARIWSQAFLIAPPLRSAPELAAVAEVLGTLSVRVGASRTKLSGTPERGGRDLDHLGVQALAHLGAAVVDQHRAVLVDVHQRAGLVERGQVERDAELDRGHRQRPLGVRVRVVERGDLGLPARRSRCARSGSTRSSASRSACRTGCPYGVVWPGA